MIRFLRHLGFYFFVLFWTVHLSCGFFWTFGIFNLAALVFFLCLPQKCVFYYARFWCLGILWAADAFLGIRIRLHGMENLPREGCFILASKHQSEWETFFFQTILENPVIFLKKSLLYIPIIGLFLWRLGVVPVSATSKKNVKNVKLRREAALKRALADSRPIIIFPEGTRTAVGEKKTYQPGVYSIARMLNVPVIPCGLNSGHVWPPKSFFKNPGIIDVYFLPPVYANERAQDFLCNLEEQIEAASI